MLLHVYSIMELIGGAMMYSCTELQMATAQFSKKKVIGKGGFGTVYHRTLRQTSVAIKILNDVCLHINLHACICIIIMHHFVVRNADA